MSAFGSSGRRPLTVRLARWSATHRWRAIALWLVFVAACIGLGQAAGLHKVTDLDMATGQSGRAAHLLHDAHLDEPVTENVLITARNGPLDTGTANAAAADVTRRMHALPQVASVAAPKTSARAVLVTVTMAGDPQTADERITPLIAATAAAQHDYPALRVEQAGSASVNKAVSDLVNKDLGSAATFSLPITLVILLIAFGAIVAAGVPVLLALSAVAAATGLSAVASHVIPDSGTTSSMILLMGMAVGVDYSLFYVKRARSERHRGRTHLDAIEIAAETSGHSVLVSGAAVIVSMLGLFLAGNAVFSSLAVGSIMVVSIAVLGSLTVLPAVLVALGRRIERPRVPVLWRLAMGKRPGRLWPTLLSPATARPGRTLAVSVLALGLLAVPALGLTLQSSTATTLPDSLPATHTVQRLTAAFPSEQSTHVVVVRAPAASAGAVTQALTAMSARLVGDPRFGADTVAGAVRGSADGTVHVVNLDVAFDPESRAAKTSLHALRNDLLPQALHGIPHVEWAVGGDTAINADVDHQLSAALPWVIGFVVLLTMVIMAWVFRSLVIALTTAAVNLLSAGASFGVLVLVFQHHWAEGLLGFHSTGAVTNWIPLFTFAVLFGLSMDYHVFVISHIREVAALGMSTRDAVRVGITRSAGTVTSAALVMVSVFAIFASLHMVEMKELGVGLAVAVLIDAMVVRVIVLPAVMTLLGRWNWWPGRPGDRQPSVLGEGHRSVDLVGSV